MESFAWLKVAILFATNACMMGSTIYVSQGPTATSVVFNGLWSSGRYTYIYVCMLQLNEIVVIE